VKKANQLRELASWEDEVEESEDVRHVVDGRFFVRRFGLRGDLRVHLFQSVQVRETGHLLAPVHRLMNALPVCLWLRLFGDWVLEDVFVVRRFVDCFGFSGLGGDFWQLAFAAGLLREGLAALFAGCRSFGDALCSGVQVFFGAVDGRLFLPRSRHGLF